MKPRKRVSDVMRWLIENVGLMLLALLLALAVWAVAQWNDDPILVDDLSIPVQVKNLPRDTHLVDGWQQEVRLRLRAAQSVWDQLGPGQFRAFLDLSPPSQGPLEPGLYEVPVDASTGLESVVILGVEPTWVEVELESIKERPAPVEVTVKGEPELGYQAGEPQVLSDTIKVRGPASLVAQVAQLSASVSLRGDEKETVEEVVSLNPVDATGRRVSGVTLDPERVRVRVPMRKLFNYKEMVVDVEVLGEPAPDYHVVGMSVNPEVVRVVGSASILDDLPGVLSTVPISIGGRTENVVERLPLVLGPGIATVYPSEPAVQVTVQIEPDQGSVTLTRTLTFQGLQTSLEAIASPPVVEVILSGPRPRLSALLPDDVPVILDLSGLRLGQVEQLAPVVLQPEGITVDSVIPSIVQVEVVRKSTDPTPKPQE